MFLKCPLPSVISSMWQSTILFKSYSHPLSDSQHTANGVHRRHFCLMMSLKLVSVLYNISCCGDLVYFLTLSHKSPPYRWTHHRSNRSQTGFCKIMFQWFGVTQYVRGTIKSQILQRCLFMTYVTLASFCWNLIHLGPYFFLLSSTKITF